MDSLDSLRLRTALDAIKIELDEVRKELQHTRTLSTIVDQFRTELAQWRDGEAQRQQVLLQLASDQISSTLPLALKPVTQTLEQMKSDIGGTKQTLAKSIRDGFPTTKKQIEQIKKNFTALETRLEQAVVAKGDKDQTLLKGALNGLQAQLATIEAQVKPKRYFAPAQDMTMPSPVRAPPNKKQRLGSTAHERQSTRFVNPSNGSQGIASAEKMVDTGSVAPSTSADWPRLCAGGATTQTQLRAQRVADWALTAALGSEIPVGLPDIEREKCYLSADGDARCPPRQATNIGKRTREDKKPIKARRVILQEDDSEFEFDAEVGRNIVTS
ncbi:hypothetical protein OIV83_005424 [Microbotryomycetes sp. JL201]|nr:hypothetical protein OIV83_005424 [Microbotryomycetes sp. JL201]